MLAFPCNQFGEQEPQDAASVYAAMVDQYVIEFPMFNKVDVVGPAAHPVFRRVIGKHFDSVGEALLRREFSDLN